MNNLWHTNFRHSQEGLTTFRYYLQVHHAYDAFSVNQTGLANHRPLIAAAAAGSASESLFFNIDTKAVYIESIKPADDGKGVVLLVVNTSETASPVTFTAKNKGAALNIWESNMLEAYQRQLINKVTLPGKGIMMLRVEMK